MWRCTRYGCLGAPQHPQIAPWPLTGWLVRPSFVCPPRAPARLVHRQTQSKRLASSQIRRGSATEADAPRHTIPMPLEPATTSGNCPDQNEHQCNNEGVCRPVNHPISCSVVHGASSSPETNAGVIQHVGCFRLGTTGQVSGLRLQERLENGGCMVGPTGTRRSKAPVQSRFVRNFTDRQRYVVLEPRRHPWRGRCIPAETSCLLLVLVSSGPPPKRYPGKPVGRGKRAWTRRPVHAGRNARAIATAGPISPHLRQLRQDI
jgi:hypothetical protein